MVCLCTPYLPVEWTEAPSQLISEYLVRISSQSIRHPHIIIQFIPFSLHLLYSAFSFVCVSAISALFTENNV